MEDIMNIKHFASACFSVFSLAILTTAGCSAEDTDEMGDMDIEVVEFEPQDLVEDSTSMTTIAAEHSKIKAGYIYDKTTQYNGQTLTQCAQQELDQLINAGGALKHYPCTAGKLKNLHYRAGGALPNWPGIIGAWGNSSGHKATIMGSTRVGCATVAPSHEWCLANKGVNYCRFNSCAYSN
jgi:hypothetical protein